VVILARTKDIVWLLKEKTAVALSWIPETRNFNSKRKYGSIDTWWYNGSLGITLTFDRLYKRTRDITYAQVIRSVLNANPLRHYHGNIRCHGLTVVGEVYLEAYRTLRDPWLFRVPLRIASLLKRFARKSELGASWLVEGVKHTADLMVGCSGIIHFFLKINGGRFGFPAMLNF
jgi:lantibiotic modifying enzyme